MSGKIYVTVAAPADTSRVAFFLDGATERSRVDYTSPYDLVRPTSSGAAAPFDTASLSSGAHVLRARVVTAAGVLVLTATFTVLGFHRDGGRPYAPGSAWNVPIPTNPTLDPGGAAMVRRLASSPGIADLYEYGFPVFDATAMTPRYTVNCTKPWGTCGLERQSVPIPDGAQPSPGTDGAMVVIDWSARLAYDFWQARRTADGGWVASWGTVSSIDGDGRTDGATGPGLPVLAGLIRAREIERGVIDHAIAFSTDNACREVFRYPAWKTDGGSAAADCIPEGSRVQLDPELDVAAIPGITPAEVTVGRALQKYGAYVRDNGGATMAFGFENPVLRPDPYPAAGLAWDYAAMPHIPWSQLRVLRQWDGG